jgi:hypothetical protein
MTTPTVYAVTIIVAKPSRKEPLGRLAYGFYTEADGLVTLTDKEGKPAGDETGKKYSRKLAPNEDGRAVACIMTKQLRLALKGNNAPNNGFEKSKINYPKTKVV